MRHRTHPAARNARPGLYGLHEGELPEVDRDLFIAAGAAAAERAARDPVARVALAGILRRALQQAAELRGDK